jgi:hypothetical protein
VAGGEGGIGGVDPGGGGGRSGLAAALQRIQQAQQLDSAMAAIHLRRRPVSPIGAAASGPTTTEVSEKHVLQSDFTTVGSTLKSNAVDVIRDADGKMTFFADAGASGSSTFGTATLNFGAFPGTNEASVVVTGQPVVGTSKVDCFIMASDTTADHTENDHRYAALFLGLSAGTIDVGVGFTIYARSLEKLTGTFSVRWRWT